MNGFKATFFRGSKPAHTTVITMASRGPVRGSPFPEMCISFLGAHSHVKSSAVLRDTLGHLRAVCAGAPPGAFSVFIIAFERNLLSMEKALLWMTFLYEGGQKGFVCATSDFLSQAMEAITSHYNLDHSNLVGIHYDSLTGESDEDTDEDED